MKRGTVQQMMSAVAMLVILVSMAAQVSRAKDTKPGTKATMSLTNSAWLEGKELKPGDYDVAVTDTVVTLSKGGKVLVEAPIQWKDEQGKSPYSTFVTEGNKLTEIHFSGKTRYVTIQG
jgi:hypothetical protein